MIIRCSILFTLITFLGSLLRPDCVLADDVIVSSSSEIKRINVHQNFDPRINTLTSFLKVNKSPLAVHARIFVIEADKNGLDWRLVPSISGVESSFGKRIPFKSYNAFGWANGDFRFNSWEHSINMVSSSLNSKYYKKGATNINKIAKRYAPPSISWGKNVKYFMKKIDPIPVVFDL